MRWSVTYRSPTGKLISECVEADSGQELFRILAARGISAIRVDEAAKEQCKQRKRRILPLPRIVLAVACCLLLVAMAFVAIHLLFSASTKSNVGHGKSKRIKDVSPTHQRAGTTESTNTNTVGNVAALLQPTNSVASSANDEARAEEEARLQKWRDKFAKRRSIFTNASDQILGWIASAPPGRDMPPMPISKSIDRDFEKSLETPIKITPEDTEEVKRLKERVMELRAQILEIKANQGLSVYDIITQHQEVFNENALIRRNAQKEEVEIFNSGDAESAEIYVKRMNEELEKLGAEPIRLPGEPNEELRQHIRDKLKAIKESKR